jgi:hypothetical protein
VKIGPMRYFAAMTLIFRWALVLGLFATGAAASPLWANIAMPGVFSAGGNQSPSLLTAADSLAAQFVQMRAETVCVAIGPGWAAVYGRYWFQNTHTQPIAVRAGFPVQARGRSPIYEMPVVYQVNFDSLYDLRVLRNGMPVSTFTSNQWNDTLQQFCHPDGFDPQYAFQGWQADFPPGQRVLYEVFYCVKTENALQIHGYDQTRGQAFGYIFSSGGGWAGRIDTGLFVLQAAVAQPPLQPEGLLPQQGWYRSPTHRYVYRFYALEPTDSTNVLLWLGPENPYCHAEALAQPMPSADSLYTLLRALYTDPQLGTAPEAVAPVWPDSPETDSPQMESGSIPRWWMWAVLLLVMGALAGGVLLGSRES